MFISGYGFGIFGVLLILFIAFYLPYDFRRIRKAERERQEQLRAREQRRTEDAQRLFGKDAQS